jgi:hypothetical protein
MKTVIHKMYGKAFNTEPHVRSWFRFLCLPFKSKTHLDQDSSVCIVTKLCTGQPWNCDVIPGWDRVFSCLHNVQASFEAQQKLLP